MPLLPTVDTAVLLGFLRVEEGDAVITPEGQAFAQADIQARKAIFRKAALANVPLLRQMEQALKVKSNRTLSEEFFPRPPRRTLQRRRIPPPARNRHPVGAATPKFSITTPPPAS